MATPLLIDTDMGVDDAMAVTLAVCSESIALAGLVSVGGNVPVDQATTNVGRLLSGLQLASWPPIARGLDQTDADLQDAAHVFGADGLGEIDLPAPPNLEPEDHLALYERLIDTHGEDLVILAIGPLTNLAAVMDRRPGLLERAGRIIVMGGAVFCPGNVTKYAEFNFHRDPSAAATVLTSGLEITVVPLDVTRQVVMDESHAAHLSCSGTRSGEILGRMLRYPMEQPTDEGAGKVLVHDALALGVLLWPEIFIRSKMALEVVPDGEQTGRSKPRVVKDPTRKLGVVISVNVGDFLDNLVEQLCHERFVV